jgi:hypothetical protein
MRDPASELLSNSYSEEYIQSLHIQFRETRLFRERLELFDREFGILPHPFPPFNPGLSMFFEPNALNEITELFNRERRHSFVAERRFEFDGREYLFRIVPFNNYPQIQNDYILSRFLIADGDFDSAIAELERMKNYDETNFLVRKRDAESLIDTIRRLLGEGIDQSFRSRFMTVFFAGYSDQATRVIKKFTNRKKFIELYLYAQGILFRKYQEVLEE